MGRERNSHDQRPPQPGGTRVVDAFAVDFELRKEDLRDDAAEFARAGGEAHARCTIFCWEYFGGYLREVRCQFEYMLLVGGLGQELP